jgi:hypothetical protein
MPTKQDVLALLAKLDRQKAMSLETQTLEFKGWLARSFADSVRIIVDAVICQANGGPSPGRAALGV